MACDNSAGAPTVPSDTVCAVSVIETVVVFVVIPAAIYGLLGLWTLRSKFSGHTRYRPGQDWPHPPVWWTANPEGAAPRHGTTAADTDSVSATSLGGARGSW